MKRWNGNSELVEDPRVDACLDEVFAVMRKHGMSIGHEDGHGAFIVRVPLVESDIEWLRTARVERTS